MISLSTGFVYNSVTIKLIFSYYLKNLTCDWMRVIFSKLCTIYC